MRNTHIFSPKCTDMKVKLYQQGLKMDITFITKLILRWSFLCPSNLESSKKMDNTFITKLVLRWFFLCPGNLKRSKKMDITFITKVVLRWSFLCPSNLESSKKMDIAFITKVVLRKSFLHQVIPKVAKPWGHLSYIIKGTLQEHLKCPGISREACLGDVARCSFLQCH